VESGRYIRLKQIRRQMQAGTLDATLHRMDRAGSHADESREPAAKVS
jgi:hypothetical protein